VRPAGARSSAIEIRLREGRSLLVEPRVALYLALIQERFAVLSLETWCREYCT
jgi:hypothetical protein